MSLLITPAYSTIMWTGNVSGTFISLSLSLPFHSDIEKIQSGIGDKVAVFLSYFSTFITGFIIAFSKSWKMALVVLTMLPLITFVAATVAKVHVLGGEGGRDGRWFVACNSSHLDSLPSSNSLGQVIASFTVREQSAYAAAGAVAEEVISSIRTVVAFGGEEKEAGR